MAGARRITPGARARRALLVDGLAAIAVAALVLSLTAGLGVVGFFGLPVLLFGLAWVGIERLLRSTGSRRPRGGRDVTEL